MPVYSESIKAICSAGLVSLIGLQTGYKRVVYSLVQMNELDY